MEPATPVWKRLLGCFGVAALVGLLALVALGLWARNAAEELLVDAQLDLPAVAEEGVRFAATHSAVACVEEGRNRAVRCGALAITCQLSANVFGSSCLDAATADPTVCSGVPASGDALARVTWSQERCAQEGHADRAACASFYQQVVVTHCAGPGASGAGDEGRP